MEYYILIGMILGIIVAAISFIYRCDLNGYTMAGKVIMTITHVIESLFFGVMMVILWAPAIVIVGTIAILAIVAG